MDLQHKALLRVFRDLAAEELSNSRNDFSSSESSRDWTTETTIRDRDERGAGSIGVDSLELIQLATRISEFFELKQFGIGDSLLRGKTIQDWCGIIYDFMQPDWESITVRSSGTTGTPQTWAHSRKNLKRECGGWETLLGSVGRIVSLVPAHHLYGLVWGCLLPASIGKGGLEVVDARWETAQGWLGQLKSGDVVIGFPFRYQMMPATASTLKVPADVTAVSSAGELEAKEWETLNRLGFNRVLEIYGASEAGGIGWRSRPGADFELAKHWKGRHQELNRLPDNLEWTGKKTFRLLGRKDGYIKIAGSLVDPKVVSELIAQHPLVRECSVRRDSIDAQEIQANLVGTRLKAFIAPVHPGLSTQDLKGLANELRKWVEPQLPPAARPVSYEFGISVPRTAMGKELDWHQERR